MLNNSSLFYLYITNFWDTLCLVLNWSLWQNQIMMYFCDSFHNQKKMLEKDAEIDSTSFAFMMHQFIIKSFFLSKKKHLSLLMCKI